MLDMSKEPKLLKSRQDNLPTIADCRKYIHEMIEWMETDGQPFHPDTEFRDYVDIERGEFLFKLEHAARLTSQMLWIEKVLDQNGLTPGQVWLAIITGRRLEQAALARVRRAGIHAGETVCLSYVRSTGARMVLQAAPKDILLVARAHIQRQ
jgi:hypothetical protein